MQQSNQRDWHPESNAIPNQPTEESDQQNNKFKNYNIEEHQDITIKNKISKTSSSLNIDKYTYWYKSNIEFNMQSRKIQKEMKTTQKAEMEILRRFYIKITNIYITPLIKMWDPFWQFTIAGDFQIQIYKNKQGKTVKRGWGKRGYSFKTEVLTNINTVQQSNTETTSTEGRTQFSTTVELEIRMTYSMINKSSVMVELWDHNRWWMNEIISYVTIPWIDIVNGNVNISEYMLTKEEGRKSGTPFAWVEFRCVFEEIWDFNLNFNNWRCSSLLPDAKGDGNEFIDSRLEIKLLGESAFSQHKVAWSEECKGSNIPIWNNFSNTILYRGTWTQWENEEIEICLYNTSPLFHRLLSKKTVKLNGIKDYQKINTELVITEDSNKSKATPVNIQGMISIDFLPWYRQTGQNTTWWSTKNYWVIKVIRVENIIPIDNIGIVTSFVNVDWGRTGQKTQSIKENNNPYFNALLFYELPWQDKWLNNPSKYQSFISNEMQLKNEITFSLMIECDEGNFDNWGIGYAYLSNMKQGIKATNKYYLDDLGRDKEYICDKYSGKVQLVSALTQSETTFLYYEMWFWDKLPIAVDFNSSEQTGIKSERVDKYPHGWKDLFPNGNDTVLSKEYQGKIKTHFMKYSTYALKDRWFDKIVFRDQYTTKHWLPFYLSLITLPQWKVPVKEGATNEQIHDNNIRSLDEIAHFIRCFPFSFDRSDDDVICSPDMMWKKNKGNWYEHAVLMACWMMGLRKEDVDWYEQLKLQNRLSNNTLLIPSYGKNESNRSDNNNNKTTNINNNRDLYLFENRIFMCWGRWKETLEPYAWVMHINENYRDITFYDPKISFNCTLHGRVANPNLLRNFLNLNYDTYTQLQEDALNTSTEKRHHSPWKAGKTLKIQKINTNTNWNRTVKYNENEDFKDTTSFLNETISYQASFNNDKEIRKIKERVVNKKMIDQKILNHNPGDFNKEMNNYSFIENDDIIEKEILNDSEIRVRPVDVFKLGHDWYSGEVVIPYETIDVIFNRNNIYTNFQYHSPDKIYYNIYDRDAWFPYFHNSKSSDAIFREKFDCFYPLCPIGATFSQSWINKMENCLSKEIRVAIAISRQCVNWTTRLKRKNEKIVDYLRRYLEYLEDIARGRLKPEEFKHSIWPQWKILMIQYMPMFYTMQSVNMFHNYFDPEKIRRSVEEELKWFLHDKRSDLIFANACSIFAYPNKIISVRFIIAKFYRIPLENISNTNEIDMYLNTQGGYGKREDDDDSDDDDENAIKKEDNLLDKNIDTNLKDNTETEKNKAVRKISYDDSEANTILNPKPNSNTTKARSKPKTGVKVKK